MFGDPVDRIPDTETAQYLQAAEVEVAGLRVDESSAALFDQQRVNAVACKHGRHRQTAHPGAGYQDRKRRLDMSTSRHATGQ